MKTQQTLIERPHNEHEPLFEEFWQSYPRRGRTKGANDNKIAAARCWQHRQRQGYSAGEMIEGAKRYAEYCEAVNCIGTAYVMQARTFLGPDCHFRCQWEAPETKPGDHPWAKIPRDDNALWDWAKEHSYPNPGSMNFYQYRQLLQQCVERRLNE